MKAGIMKTGTVVMIFLMAGIVGFSQPPKGRMMMQEPGYHQVQMQKFLKLTDDQQTKLKDLKLAQTKEMLPLRNKMMVLMAEYHELISAEKPDMKKVNANIDARTKLMNQIMKKNAEFKLKFRNILTEEQWLILQSRAGKMKRGFHGRGMGMEPGRSYGMSMHHGFRGYGPPRPEVTPAPVNK